MAVPIFSTARRAKVTQLDETIPYHTHRHMYTHTADSACPFGLQFCVPFNFIFPFPLPVCSTWILGILQVVQLRVLFEAVANVSLGMFHDPLSCTNNYNLIYFGLLQVVGKGKPERETGRGHPSVQIFPKTDSKRFECERNFPPWYAISMYLYLYLCVFFFFFFCMYFTLLWAT